MVDIGRLVAARAALVLRAAIMVNCCAFGVGGSCGREKREEKRGTSLLRALCLTCHSVACSTSY